MVEKKTFLPPIHTFDTGLLLVAPEAEVRSAGPESLDTPRGGHQHPVAEEVARVVRVDQGRVILNITGYIIY